MYRGWHTKDGVHSDTIVQLAQQDLDTTVAEDIVLVESVQRGHGSLGYRPGPLVIDRGAFQASWNDSVLDLTPVEFELLALFAAHPNEVLPRSRLLSAARGTDYAGYERNINSHMKNLRKKLRARLDDRDPFRTVYGVGYALNRDLFAPPAT